MTDNTSVKKPSRTANMALSTLLVMIGLVFSKCSGFLRDIFVADRFNDIYRDSFTLAFTIPDLVYNLLIGGAIQSAITPSLSASIAAGEEKKGWKAVSIFISVFACIMFIVCVVGVVFSEQIYSLYTALDSKSDYSPETVHLAAMASKMLFPQIFFMMLAALSIGILNAYKRFGSTAFGPTVYNVFVLGSILIFAGNSESKLMMTTAGIMGAAVIYFLFQYIIGFDKLKQFRFEFKPKDSDFIKLVKRALPILISASIVQVNMVILNFFALSFHEDGSIFALRQASTVWQLPYGIFAVAIGNVMLPSLAALYNSGKGEDASELLSSRLKSALFLTIPSAGFMIIMNTDVIKAVYQWSSNYTDEAASRAGTFLIGYSIAIITHTVVFIMNQAFYAIGKTKVPLIAGSVGLISNPVLCTLLIGMGYGPLSLTLAYSTTSILQMVILCILYCRDKVLAPRHMIGFVLKSAISLVVMVVVLIVVDKLLPGSGNKIKQLTIIASKFVISFVVYFAGAAIFKMPEAIFWINRFKSKLKRT